ncbi:hypothetical protein [Mesorhizobium sp. WSM3859]|uniref:hypothetical protein n=1 Tax=Mesorhizobium sp. WSM3859 TaxID=2029402 RepID=UPI000BB06D0B|nr:hypothetical protein [Mesorhizobium sp. WSM3859]PBC06666.1 hypothetical protein CK230_30530 [Mesorhizobium sp. WSM3859]
MRVEFHGLQFELSQGWEDITGDLERRWPPTLAGPLVGGVLQFSVARYKSGKLPNVTIGDLRRMLLGYCTNLARKFHEPVEKAGRINAVERVSNDGEELLAVWHLSNGRDVVLATYIGASPRNPQTGNELSQARQLVESIEF